MHYHYYIDDPIFSLRHSTTEKNDTRIQISVWLMTYIFKHTVIMYGSDKKRTTAIGFLDLCTGSFGNLLRLLDCRRLNTF
jgi:hypothetical protein